MQAQNENNIGAAPKKLKLKYKKILRMRSRHLEQGDRTGPILMTWMQSLALNVARKGTSHKLQCNDIHDSMNIIIPV